jgi:short-subunit dehydrogenase
MKPSFVDRYGPVALVAGASEGLGAAFAAALARRGLELVLVARRAAPLEELAARLRADHGVAVTTLALDLGRDADLDRLFAATATQAIGLVVHNAAASPIGTFLDVSVADHRRVLAVNCTAGALLAHHYARAMVERRRGGLVLVSSMSGLQGTAMVAHYAASKSYLRVLAEGLGNELRPLGVDVLAPLAGPVRTPGYAASAPAPSLLTPAPGEPDAVVAASLAALGRGSTCVPGSRDRVLALVLERVLPRGIAVDLISAVTRRMYRRDVRG